MLTTPIYADWDGVGETDYLRKSLEDVIREDLEEAQLTEEPESESSSSDSDSSASDSDSEDEDAGKKDETTKKGETTNTTDEAKKDGEGKPDGKDETNPDKVEVGGEVTISVPDVDKVEKKEISPAEWVDLLDDQGIQEGLGLRVYTHTQEPARVTGRIRSEDVNWEY